MLGPFSPSAAETLRRASPRKGTPAPGRGRHHALPLALVAVAGAAIFLLVIAINMAGDGIRDVTSPEGRG